MINEKGKRKIAFLGIVVNSLPAMTLPKILEAPYKKRIIDTA